MTEAPFLIQDSGSLFSVVQGNTESDLPVDLLDDGRNHHTYDTECAGNADESSQNNNDPHSKTDSHNHNNEFSFLKLNEVFV